MRISQIKTLCWLGNGIVLVASGYVGLHFWETYQERQVRTEVEWPDRDGAVPIEKRWPGAITAFTKIWSTHVNGLVPEPPKPPDTTPKPRDPAAIFKAKYKLGTIWHDVLDPFRSVAFLSHGSKKDDLLAVRTGERLDGFTFAGIAGGTASPELVFTHPDVETPVRLKFDPSKDPGLVGGDPGLVGPLENATDVARPPAERHEISRPAYQDVVTDPSGLTWRVPAEEQDWWAAFGEDEVFAKVSVQTRQDADGNAVGVTLRSPLGQGTPVGEGRGLLVGDTIVAINGVPVATKEDILRYLRGEGRGLTRYEVKVENETGAERTLVYILARTSRT